MQKVHIPISPLFKVNYEADTPIVINQGGTSCFAGSQLVVTDKGSKPISDIKQGDIVKCYNEQSNQNEWRKVLNTFEYDNHKPTIRVRLKNGHTITATEDHKFYHNGQWIALKELLSLRDEQLENNTQL